ncbi:MAG: periplasmic component of amino acid ABC-type transporter/signal transduction system [Clostridium sp. Maddingley MBC34-26]|nr:MAG: periplasmic component of amino acid ABC-type transporter/signal transduction system [Clostridium sp. Maddingley MBC34-26]
MKKVLFNLIVAISIIGIIVCVSDIMKTRTVENPIDKDRLQEIKEKGVLTVASPLYDIPFFYVDPKTNKISGIDADIINEIAKRIGINKIETKETLFSNLLEKLITDDSIDMAAGGIYITPEREKLVAFTQPLYKESETVVVPQFSKVNFVIDLKDTVIGVEKGTVFENLAQKWKKNNLIKDVVTFKDIS